MTYLTTCVEGSSGLAQRGGALTEVVASPL